MVICLLIVFVIVIIISISIIINLIIPHSSRLRAAGCARPAGRNMAARALLTRYDNNTNDDNSNSNNTNADSNTTTVMTF